MVESLLCPFRFKIIILFLLSSAVFQGDSKFSSHASTVILVSLDGMGCLANHKDDKPFASTPNLNYVASRGVKAKCIHTVTPSLTWPNHHTYMTGLYPESHGIVSNVFYDPYYKEIFIYEKDCSNYDPKFYNDSEPIWLTLQKQGGRSGVYFWPGSGGYEEEPTFYEKPICDVDCRSRDELVVKRRNVSYWPHCTFNYSEPWHHRIDKIMGWLTSTEAPQFIMIYVEEPDSAGHKFGAFSREYLRQVELVDKNVVGYLLKSLNTLNILNKVNLLFVTDHGFANVSESRQIYLDDYVDPALYFLTQAGTAAHIWPHEGRMDEVYQSLKRIRHSNISIYKREDIPDELHWKNNRRIPPIFVAPDLGWQVMQSAPERSVSPEMYSAHGWPGKYLEMGSMFVAMGPAFRVGAETSGFQSVDIYTLLCHLLALNPRPSNGSIERVKDLLEPSQFNSLIVRSRATTVNKDFLSIIPVYLVLQFY